MCISQLCHVVNPCGAWRDREPWSADVEQQQQSTTSPHASHGFASNTDTHTFLYWSRNNTFEDVNKFMTCGAWAQPHDALKHSLVLTLDVGCECPPICDSCIISTKPLVWSANAKLPQHRLWHTTDDVLIQSVCGFNLHLKRRERIKTGTRVWSVISHMIGAFTPGGFQISVKNTM